MYPGKGPEVNVGIALLYFIVSLDTNISLTNDKKSLLNPSWDEVKKQFSNGGKIVSLFKKVKDYIENDMIANPHFNQILVLADSLNAAPTSQEDVILPLFLNYLQNAIILTKFIKSIKGQADEHLKLLS